MFFKFFIEKQLVYNVVLVSGVQQSDSVGGVCVCVYTWLFLFVILAVIIISEFIRGFSNNNLS